MNLRNVLRAYSLLRQLSDDESALLNILRAMNDSDREALVVSMSDKPPQKKSSKKAAGAGGKSKRAASLGSTLRDNLQRRTTATNDDDSADLGLCIVGIDSKGETCGETADHNVHHLSTHPDYHEFKAHVPTATAASGD